MLTFRIISFAFVVTIVIQGFLLYFYEFSVFVLKRVRLHYQVDDNRTKEAMDEMFDISIPLKDVSES